MTAQQLLTELYRLGVELKPDGDRILYRPQELVPPALLAEMKEHKPALLEYLRDDSFEPVECPNCGSIDVWFSGLDRPHCMVCDPPSPLAAAFYENAHTIRSRIEQAGEHRPPVSRMRIPPDAIEVEGPPCPVCGSTRYLDIPAVFDSRRRDCWNCGRTVGFPRWRGEDRDIVQTTTPNHHSGRGGRVNQVGRDERL